MSYETRIFWFIVGIILVGVLGYYYFFLQIYLAILGVIFLITGITFFITYHRAWPKILEEKYAQLEKKKLEPTPGFNERWQPIRQIMKSHDLNELRVTIIDSDTLVEELLRAQGIEGDTMAGLIAEATLRGIIGTEVISRFHRLRNRIVHESTFVPPIEEMQKILIMLDEVLVRWGVVLPPEV